MKKMLKNLKSHAEQLITLLVQESIYNPHLEKTEMGTTPSTVKPKVKGCMGHANIILNIILKYVSQMMKNPLFNII